ncbi:MAG: flavodoxin domain-containing protein [Erysipelotrichaceae bacterium]
MKTIIIYKTKTGFTKKYADMIAKELECKAIPASCLTALDLNNYDSVIFGEAVYAGHVEGLKPYKEDLRRFKGKIAIYLVGINANNELEVNKTIEAMDAPNINKTNSVFYLPGGIDYTQLGFKEKLIMKVISKQLNKKDDGLIDYSKNFDCTDIKYIKEIVDYIKSN